MVDLILDGPSEISGFRHQFFSSVVSAPGHEAPGNMAPGESGGIGRRAGFRIQWGNPWEFESPLSHQLCADRYDSPEMTAGYTGFIDTGNTKTCRSQ